MPRHYHVCFSIAGSDPSGGAGVQADIKTFSALGCYGAGAVTAITVQNTCGVSRTVPLDAQLVFEQIVAVMTDMQPQSVKIGMTANAAITEAVSSALRQTAQRATFIVLDPILLSSSGHPLLDQSAVATLLTRLLPLCSLVTPNLPELRALTSEDDAAAAARKLQHMAAGAAVLVKGGHREGQPTDVLLNGTETHAYAGERILTANTHGTGCALSSAIAAWRARGLPLALAVDRAKKFVGNALKNGADVHIGNGHGPMNHFFAPEPALIEEK